MALHSSIPPPTQDEQRVQDLMREAGCICCAISFCPTGLAVEIHHLTRSGRRIGQRFVLPLCSHHHRGVPCDRWTTAQMLATFGPSLAVSSRLFHARYGSDAELLAQQYQLIGEPHPEPPQRAAYRRPAKVLDRWPRVDTDPSQPKLV